MALASLNIIQQMADVLAREANPVAVILFGSHAAGTAGPDSDIDLIVIEEGPFGLAKSRRHEIVRLHKALAVFNVPLDLLVYSREEANERRDAINHVLARAMREGQVLYGSI